MPGLVNLARMTTATIGTGTITLGSAVASYLTFAQAGVLNGETVSYAIVDGNNREVGIGVYTSSGTTLTRTVLKSTNGNNPISLSGSAQVAITALTEDFSGRLAAEIMADVPTAYWKCNDSGATLADSSGNGFNLTVVGTPTMQASYLVPSNHVDKYFRVKATTDGAQATTSLGTSPPLTGDWTLTAIVQPETQGVNFVMIFSLGLNSSETEANNAQLFFTYNTAQQTAQMLWEHGAGTNETIVQSPARAYTVLDTAHWHIVKDGTANTVTFWRNGRKIGAGAVSYTNEPTGGTGSIMTSIGYDGTNSASSMVIGEVAFYNGQKLSDARIRAHTRASGILY